MEPTSLLVSVAALYPICIQGYRTFASIRDFQNTGSALFWKLKTQELRFTTWGDAHSLKDANVADDHPTVGPAQFQKYSKRVLELVHGVLVAMQEVMHDVDRLVDRYGLEILDPISMDQPTVAKAPQKSIRLRARWAIRDRKAFEALVNDLRDFNDALDATLTPMVLQLVDFSVRSQLTASAGRVEDLQTIKTMDNQTGLLHNMASFKSLNLVLHGQRPTVLTQNTNREIEISDLRVINWNNFSDTGLWHTIWKNSSSVLVEWKYYSTDLTSDSRASFQLTADRVRMLVQLLTSEYKPREFEVLDCLGYIHDGHRSRFGIVYRLYNWTQGNSPGPLEIYDSKVWFTLSEVIRENTKMPLLGHRLQLALTLLKSMIQLHATGWFHKGYDSEKVVFFRDAWSGGQEGLPTQSASIGVDIRRPKLIGFDYSRPIQRSEFSEFTDRFLLNHSEKHTHPDYLVLFGEDSDAIPRPGYQAEYDMYSLGCVLLEIGLWRPLSALWKPEYAGDLAAWKDRLCRKFVPDLGGRCGERYQLVVHSLLTQTDGVTSPGTVPLTNFELLQLMEEIHT